MKTIFCDIDGTLIKHHGSLSKQLVKPELLLGTIATINSWDREGNKIILVTGRRESMRKVTEKQLSDLGIFYDKLIMGLGGFDRILINDRKTNGRTTAYAYNLDRNCGISSLNFDESNRPWGTYEVLLDSSDCKVKKITIKPGQRPSYQYHHKRVEYWTIISGSALVTIDDQKTEHGPGASIYIPLGVKHQIQNIGKDSLTFIEVQLGDYFGEDDIVRVSDDYGRK